MDKRTDQSQSQAPNGGAPRIALIGCGAIAEAYYLPVIAKRPQILEKLILVDQNIERAKKLASSFNMKRCVADYHEIFAETDGAINALPTHLHYPVTLEFLAQGIPVLCEKPLAENAKSAREMVELADQKRVALAVNYLQRLIPCFAQAKEWISEKKFGELRSIKYSVGEEFDWPSVSGFYFNSPISARGVLRDRGAHVVDHICWWLGEKPQLISSKNDAYGGSEALAHVLFKHGSCSGEIKLSWLASFPCQFRLEFDNATVIGDVYDYQNIMVEEKTGRKQQIKINSKLKSKLAVAQKIVDNFVDVINKVDQPLVAGKDVLGSVEFIDECYAKASPLETPWYETKDVQNA